MTTPFSNTDVPMVWCLTTDGKSAFGLPKPLPVMDLQKLGRCHETLMFAAKKVTLLTRKIADGSLLVWIITVTDL